MATTPQDDRPDGDLEGSASFQTFVAGSRASFGDEAGPWRLESHSIIGH